MNNDKQPKSMPLHEKWKADQDSEKPFFHFLDDEQEENKGESDQE